MDFKASKIGIGIVGTGFGQSIHIPAFQMHPDTEVVAVYHRDRLKAEQIAQKHHIPHACDRLEDLLALPTVQGVAISTPPKFHYEQCREAIAAGKHVFLEKPVTMNAQEAIDLWQMAQTQQVVTATDFEFRHVPHWQYLKHLLDQQQVGKKRLIKIEWLVQGRANPSRLWNWYSQKEFGGGALGAIGSHAFDYVRWLFGDIRSLCGQMSTGITERPDTDGNLRPVDSDDTCNIFLELTDGTPCNICLSTVTHRGRGHWVSVYGENGTLVLGSANQSDYVHGFSLQQGKLDRAEMEVIAIPSQYDLPQTYADGRLAPVLALGDRWIHAIKTGQPMTPSLYEGAWSQLLMDLTHTSHQQRRWVDVPTELVSNSMR
ncbi:MAG: Gfo/Idh/MocA family oxidoreductase [Pseudanabaenaceae cyanobacterium bins.39]|nr:Gfo/Idh/MocA family oxidoreductase [Pseudanabaenaceae cyanobacterium bins.39]